MYRDTKSNNYLQIPSLLFIFLYHLFLEVLEFKLITTTTISPESKLHFMQDMDKATVLGLATHLAQFSRTKTNKISLQLRSEMRNQSYKCGVQVTS